MPEDRETVLERDWFGSKKPHQTYEDHFWHCVIYVAQQNHMTPRKAKSWVKYNMPRLYNKMRNERRRNLRKGKASPAIPMSTATDISSRCKRGAHVGTEGHTTGARSNSGRHVCTGYTMHGECECSCHKRGTA